MVCSGDLALSVPLPPDAAPTFPGTCRPTFSVSVMQSGTSGPREQVSLQGKHHQDLGMGGVAMSLGTGPLTLLTFYLEQN